MIADCLPLSNLAQNNRKTAGGKRMDNCDPLSVVASAAEGDLGRNQKQDEPKKKCGRPPKRQRKQLPKKGPPTQQKRCGRPSKSVTKQANIKGYFEDKPAKMQQKLQVPQRQSKRLSQEDCDDVIVCRALVTLSSKGRSARIPFRYPREVYTLLDVPYPDMDEIFD